MFKSIGHRLPSVITEPLFGKRTRYGKEAVISDDDWIKWGEVVKDFYTNTQRDRIGSYVSNSGYQVISGVDLAGKTVMEIGAGDLVHDRYWNGKPEKYYLVDRNHDFMARASARLDRLGIECDCYLLAEDADFRLDMPDNSVDVIVSFYSLEHLYPLDAYLDEMSRVLKDDGVLAGAIPAEGGLAWGLGRYFTSRRWVRNNTDVDYDKVICWEHPNFAEEILNQFESRGSFQSLSYWPLRLPLIDANLIISFICRFSRP